MLLLHSFSPWTKTVRGRFLFRFLQLELQNEVSQLKAINFLAEWPVQHNWSHAVYKHPSRHHFYTPQTGYTHFRNFPECVAKGSRFTLGVWGLSCVRRTLLNRSQTSATVRNRWHEGRMAVPMVSSAKGVTFGGFQCSVASFRVASVALCDIPTCFQACRKCFCVAGAALWRPPMSFCVAGAAL